MALYHLTLSVHQLVDFLLRSGDIDNRIFNKDTMSEGSRLHQIYQTRQSSNYLSEYLLKQSFVIDDFEITLQGRADGIIINEDGFIIDEIKTTVDDLNNFKEKNFNWHMGQAKCYALMFLNERHLDKCKIRLSYFKQGSKDKLFFIYDVSYEEVKEFVYDLFSQYLNFYNLILRNKQNLYESINNLKFPFKKYRRGQEKLAKLAYFCGKERKKLFIEAPTGIGKTISTLFPFIKLLNEDENSKIFYLTAKNSGKLSALDTIKILNNEGLKSHNIVISAKDKICPYKDKNCNPDECPLTLKYYDKLSRLLIYYLENYSTFDYENILEIALKEEVCPFELSLDLSLYCDIIICDYNYFFDPLVYMKRYFDEDASSFLILVDEAHNLVDRSKDMYSAKLDFESIKKYKKEHKNIEDNKLKRAINKLIKIGKLYDDTSSEEYTIYSDIINTTYSSLVSFYNTYLDISKNNNELIDESLNEIFLQVNKFLKIYEFFDSNFLLYLHKNIFNHKSYNLSLNLRCLDASMFIKSLLDKVKSSILFSATLSPFDYYAYLLGGNKNSDPYLVLPSPFSISNLCLMLAPNISIKYKNRAQSYDKVCEYIKSFISHKVGNYFIFTPSYEYLNVLVEHLNSYEIDADIYVQEQDMSDIDKEIFLNNFVLNPNKTKLALVVLGGAFSEGIDLVSDRLIGAIIIGVGLPKVSFELEQSSKYYDNLGFNGVDYAYTNPGMNKVMQAVGRVIRSETDKGAILLIDERYTLNKYQDLFKKEWKNYKVVFSSQDIDKLLKDFYK